MSLDVPPDGMIRTALQRLPVPAHADDFWARLDASLDGGDGAPHPIAAAARTVFVEPSAPIPSSVEPSRAPVLALVPSALRRTSNVVLLAVAATAVAVVALAGRALLDGRDGTRQVTADGQADGAADLNVLVPRPELDAASSPLSGEDEDASSTAVLAWIDDLRTGRAEDAWEAMGAGSQAHFGSLAGFEAELASVAEEHGGWSSQPEQVFVTPLRAGEEGTIVVVTLVGTVTVDGEATTAAHALPVRLVDGVAHLEPYAPAGEPEVVVPARSTADPQPAPVASGEELVVVVPEGAEAPVLRLDDEAPVVCGDAEGTELVLLEELPGQRCSYLPTRGLEAGAHTLTVAFMGSDGTSVSARSLVFEAA